MKPFSHNPIATQQQAEHELLALEYFQHSEIQAVYSQVREYWLNEVNPSADMRACFDAAFEEVMFGAVIWALNQDPLYPKVITISRLAHYVDDNLIPGSRWGIDNPDSVYRVIPISGAERYTITGRVYHRRMVENYFTLWDKNMQTVGLVSGKDLNVDDNGYFTITVDADPANGRENHIQSCPEAHEFYIRDVIFDWQHDRPNELAITRLGDHAVRPEHSQAELRSLVAEYMQKWATNTTRWNNQALHKPANDFSFTIDRDSDGALRNQIYIMGHFKLPNADTVLVLDVDMGGADYFIAPITNVWGTSNEIRSRNGCLNKTQIEANANTDKSSGYTFVVALKDPGVRNWLDPDGMHEGILTLRWAEFKDDKPGSSLGVTGRLVALKDLDKTLATSISRITPTARAAALKQRSASYQWRLDTNS